MAGLLLEQKATNEACLCTRVHACPPTLHCTAPSAAPSLGCTLQPCPNQGSPLPPSAVLSSSGKYFEQ